MRTCFTFPQLPFLEVIPALPGFHLLLVCAGADDDPRLPPASAMRFPIIAWQIQIYEPLGGREHDYDDAIVRVTAITPEGIINQEPQAILYPDNQADKIHDRLYSSEQDFIRDVWPELVAEEKEKFARRRAEIKEEERKP